MCKKTEKLASIFDRIGEIVLDTFTHNEELKQFKFLGMLAMEGEREIVYVTDIETSEILYMNENAINEFGDGLGKKCYEVFQGLDSPCKFCTNEKIKANLDTPIYWPIYNKISKKLYFIKDVASVFEGKVIRYEQAVELNGEAKEICNIINKYQLF